MKREQNKKKKTPYVQTQLRSVICRSPFEFNSAECVWARGPSVGEWVRVCVCVYVCVCI